MKKRTERRLPTTRVIIPAQELRYEKPQSEPEHCAHMEQKRENERGDGLEQKREIKRGDGLKQTPGKRSGDSLEPASKGTAGAFVAELFFSVLLLTAICALHKVLALASNIGILSFADLFGEYGQDIWINTGVSVAVFAILRIFLRKPYFACIFVAFCAFFYVNFNNLLVPFLRLFINKYTPAVIGGIALYVVLIAGFFFLLRLLYKKKFPVHTVAKILSVVFAGLVLFNVVMAFISAGKDKAASAQVAADTDVAPASAQATPAPAASGNAAEAASAAPEAFGLPNVYFFILDECGTFDIMSKYYGYDNDVFYQFLTSEGFNVSQESYATDNQTEHCFLDLLNLEYMSRDKTAVECKNEIPDAKLFSIFSDLGYSQYQMLDSKYFKGIESLRASSGQGYSDANMFGDEEEGDVAGFGALDAVDGRDSSETTVDTKALNKWGFYPSEYIQNTREYQQYKNQDNMKRADSLLLVFDYFDNPSSYKAASPRVTYAYMTATHVPFVFNEYGGIIAYNDNRNWENTDIYLNQYKFICKRMMSSISNIIANDPESIIIVMSDHGIRYHSDCNKKHTFYITDKDSCRIFNAVYIKGQPYDIEGLSGVNTLRYIMSMYEGLDYPPIEDPITSESPDDLTGIIPNHR